jgi:hypothetical protein
VTADKKLTIEVIAIKTVRVSFRQGFWQAVLLLFTISPAVFAGIKLTLPANPSTMSSVNVFVFF